MTQADTVGNEASPCRHASSAMPGLGVTAVSKVANDIFGVDVENNSFAVFPQLSGVSAASFVTIA